MLSAILSCMDETELRKLRNMVDGRLSSMECARNAQFTHEELELMRDRRKVEAIKKFRDRIQCGLLDAKAAVELCMSRMGLNPRFPFTDTPPPTENDK